MYSALVGTMMVSHCDKKIKLWHIELREYLKTLRVAKPYESMNITEIQGLTEAEKMTLKLLGAIDTQP